MHALEQGESGGSGYRHSGRLNCPEATVDRGLQGQMRIADWAELQ